MGSSKEEKEGEKVEYPTFQENWEFSDLVLVTKQRKFHVHKVCVMYKYNVYTVQCTV